MKITSLGHSAFKLEESTGTTIVTDPYDGSIGCNMPSVNADAVTVSHSHYDHNNFEAVKGNPILIDTEGAFEVKGVHISSVTAFHDNHKGKRRGKSLIFKYRLDGVEVCHMGDIGEDCSTFIGEFIMPVNVLLIPVGGKYTIDAKRAKKYVDRLMPDLVIPMHYKTKECNLDIDKVDEFLELFDEENIIFCDSKEIELDRAIFDEDCTKVLVLKN